MDLPQIRINSTHGQLGLNITKPVQRIEQQAATVQIEQPKAEMQINRTTGKLSIDQTEARADVDLKSIARRMEEFAANGREDLLSGIARVSSQGDELMRIENGGTPIIDQAVENSLVMQHEFALGWVPSAGSVKINYQPGSVDINWQTHRPNIQVDTHKPVHEYTPGKIEGYMKQWPTLEIDFVGGSIDRTI